MQNDRMAAVFESLMQEELKAGTGETKGWTINPLTEEKTDVKEFASGGYGKRIFMQDNFKGCGKYSYYFVGAVQSTYGQLNSQQMILGIVVEGPQKASECLEQVQNFQNFMPEDKDYGAGRMKGTWAGLVKRSPEDKAIAEEIPGALFGDKARNTSTELTDYPTNLLALSVDKADKETILKLILPKKTPAGETVSTPLTIQAIVGDRGLQETQGKTAAGTALENLMRGGQVQGCITADHSELRISDVKKPVNLKIEGCDTLKLLAGPSHCDFKVSRNVFDKVKISLENIGKLQGKTTFKLQEKAGDNFKDIELGKDLVDLRADEAKEFRLTAQSGAEALLVSQAESQTISLIAVSMNDSQQTKKDISLKPCGITADEMVRRVIKLEEPGTYYATISSLPGNKPEAGLCSLLQGIPDSELSSEWIAQSGCTGNKGTAYKGKVAADKTVGLLAYEGACWAACGGCVGATAWIPIVGQVIGAASLGDCAWACVPAVAIGGVELLVDNAGQAVNAFDSLVGGTPRNAVKGIEAANTERENISYDLTGSATQTTPKNSPTIWPEAVAAAAGTLGRPAYKAAPYYTAAGATAEKISAGTAISTISGPVDDFVKLNELRLTPQPDGQAVIIEKGATGTFKPTIKGYVNPGSQSYAELEAAVNNTAHALEEQGIKVEGKTLPELINARSDQFTKELDSFNGIIDDAVKTGVTSEKNVKEARTAVVEAKNAIKTAAQTTNISEVTNASSKVNTVAEISRTAGIGTWGKIWSGVKKVRGGLVCGLIGNAAGWVVYAETIAARARDLTGRVSFVNAVSEGGKEVMLQKNSTVKIIVNADPKSGQKVVSIMPVSKEQDLAAIKDSQRIDDCVEQNYYSWKQAQKGTAK